MPHRMRPCSKVVSQEAQQRMYQKEGSEKGVQTIDTNSPKVAILMGTYNGECFLPEQLDSIKRQTHTNWELHVSDDGSTDSTQAIINDFKAQLPEHQLTLRQGPKKGFATNFLAITCDPCIKADYYAFSDQDDVWESDKLERAIRWLRSIPADKPAMYCSRTRLIDENGNDAGFSPLFKRKPSFKNALVQSIAGANTMVLNYSARMLIAKTGCETPIVSHDWWAYLLVSGCGGDIYYDPTPCIRYRQHGRNLVGSNVGWIARQQRIIASFRGRFVDWNNTNISALQKLRNSLTEENRSLLSRFSEMRTWNPIKRTIAITRSGLYRQTTAGNTSLVFAAFIGKI